METQSKLEFVLQKHYTWHLIYKIKCFEWSILLNLMHTIINLNARTQSWCFFYTLLDNKWTENNNITNWSKTLVQTRKYEVLKESFLRMLSRGHSVLEKNYSLVSAATSIPPYDIQEQALDLISALFMYKTDLCSPLRL